MSKHSAPPKRKPDEPRLRAASDLTGSLPETQRFASEQERQLHAILDNAFVGIVITKNSVFDLVGRFTCEMFGYSEEDMLGQSARLIHVSDELYADFVNRVRAMLRQRGHFDGEHRMRRKDGSEFWVHFLAKGVIDGDPAGGTVWIMEDISKAKRERDEMFWKATHDALTQLPNRRLLIDKLALSINASSASKQHGAVMFIDLDNFKPLNDLHGHDMGDALLVDAAYRLEHSIREVDSAARFGGDEFVALINELGSDPGEALRKAKKIADKIRKNLAKPYVLKNGTKRSEADAISHQCTASIGVAIFSGKRKKSASILSEADQAMYRAKQTGRNCVVFFDEMQAPPADS